MAKEKTVYNYESNHFSWNGASISQYGHMGNYLVKEHGSKISNILDVKKGKGAYNSITTVKNKKIKRLIRQLKYKCAIEGELALVSEKDINGDLSLYLGKVFHFEDYGTDRIHYLKVAYKQISDKLDGYVITKEYMIDPRTPEFSKYVVKTEAFNTSTNQKVNLTKINELVGRQVFSVWKQLDTPYIPAAIFDWDENGNGVLHNMQEILLLERQLLREIPRDLNLSRKKVLYKTRLARKSAADLEIEMNEKGIVVFEDGNALFSSPIDLWAPQLAVKSITETIDWLMSYALKVTFAAKDSMSTGAQKGDKQISEINQAPQNILEDRLEAWSETMSSFLSMITNKNIEVEFNAMTTPDNLINGVVDSKKVVASEGDK